VTATSAVAPLPNRPVDPLAAALGQSRGAAGTRTTPAKLRAMLIGLLAVSFLWGVVAAWTVAEHASAADNVVTVSEPLSLDAQQIYRALSDADATEAAAFLSGGLEPLALRRRYEADIAQAARHLEAATAAAGQSAAGLRLATLSTELPVYAGLVETARADNRLGLPLGAAYLREASGLMRATLLPAASDLYAAENAQLAAADDRATGLPYLAVATAVLALLVLLASQRWLARRTNRVINPGLLVAALATLAALVWLVSSLVVARTHLTAARDRGSVPVEALARADIAALQAHADESLTLIDRRGDDSFQANYISLRKRLAPGPTTLLTEAAVAAAGSPAGRLAKKAVGDGSLWFAAHRELRSMDDGGDYADAVGSAIGSQPGDSGLAFSRLDTDLTTAISVDQASFRSAGRAGRAALASVEAGMIALCLLMAAASAWGISRRLREYR
jgi:hypothetical protein